MFYVVTAGINKYTCQSWLMGRPPNPSRSCLVLMKIFFLQFKHQSDLSQQRQGVKTVLLKVMSLGYSQLFSFP